MGIWPGWVSYIKQAADAVTGLVVERSSASTTAPLQQWTTETGAVSAEIGADGRLTLHGNGGSGAGLIDFYSNFAPVEWRMLNGDAGDELRIYNVGAGLFHWRSLPATFDVASVRPGAINPYNSLTTIKFAGLATTTGTPTSSTWVAGDYFIDSKGVAQLCTTGGTPGTWAAGGWQLAGFWKAGSALQTSGAITVTAFDELMIVARIVSLSAGDVPALRFNSDTGTNYSSGFTFTTAGTSGSNSTATVTQSQTQSTTMAKLSAQTSTGPRTIQTIVSNRSGTSKVGTITSSAIGTGAAGTLPVKDISGQFEWVNTTAQITSVTMLTAGGSATMAADSGFLVFGRDLA